MITGSQVCTHRPSLLFVLNEIRCNKVVLPEDVAGLSINLSFLLAECPFMLNYYVVRFSMI